MTTLVSCCLSAAGIRFLGILSRPGIPPLLRSAYRAATGADPSGVSMFRTREMRPGPGALYTPGTTVPARLRVNPAAAACRLTTARSLPPRCHNPSRDALSHEASARVHWRSPLPAIPLACSPRTERGPSGFTLGFTPG
jgi:hypothetical protein